MYLCRLDSQRQHFIIVYQRSFSGVFYSSGKWDADAKNIVIDVFTIKDDKQIADLFKEINSSEPVRLVDMPDEGINESDRQVISNAAEQLCGKYNEMFKSTARCRAPHLNIDNLRDDLFQNNYIKR